ncbi:hypothetical protein BJX70DRAFT_359574 [Aspergillus crustosus]
MPPASLNLGKGASPRANSSRNTAILTILGVIGGGWALFRFQSPRGNKGLVKEDDVANTTGATKLGRSKVVSTDDTKSMMGDPPQGHGNVGRAPK